MIRSCPLPESTPDYLNDDITEDGTIDYSLTEKLPEELRQVIASKEKILVLINPPYAEAMNAGDGVASTRVASKMDKTGYASRELYTQFLTRIADEMPNATVAMFSTLKYVSSPNFEKFRKTWHPKYKGGFVVHSKAFDGLNGDFPIGFLVWDTSSKAHKKKAMGEISTEILNKDAVPVGQKIFYPASSKDLLNSWIKRAKPNGVEALPLSNALTPTTRTKDVRGKTWADDAIGGMISKGSDVQNAHTTSIMSSGYNSAGGFLITKQNLDKVAMIFAVRRITRQTWQNDRDQFLIPTTPITPEFSNDCLIWMLFSTSNLTVGADGLQWNGKNWSLVNHFIPFTETEVKSPERFESDFMSKHIAKLKLSKEAKAVLNAGKTIWGNYFEHTDEYTVREQFKLNRPDVGWYQIRNALKARDANGSTPPVKWTPFETAYEALGDKLRPQVYHFGFLKA